MTSAQHDGPHGSGSGSPDSRRPPSGRRRTLVTVAAIAVVAVVAVLVVAATVLRHRGVAAPLAAASTPVTTTTPSTSPRGSTGPSGTPSSTPTDTATVEPGLPPYHRLTADVLAHAGAGWLVSLFSPDQVATDVKGVYWRVLVISPDGTVYRAADPKVDRDSQLAWYLKPVDWAAGSRQVLVEFGQGDSTDRTVLDLLTGDLVTDNRGLPPTSASAGLAADGSEVWSAVYSGGLWLVPPTGQARQVLEDSPVVRASVREPLDPSGRYVAVLRSKAELVPDVQVLDLTTGRLTPPLMAASARQGCDFAGWADPARVLLICSGSSDPSSPSLADTALTFDVSGAAPVQVSTHTYAAGEVRPAPRPVLEPLTWVAHDRLLAVMATTVPDAEFCTLKAAWFDSEGRAVDPQRPVPGGPLYRASSKDGTAYLGESLGCPGRSGLAGLTSVDPAGGTTTLVPHTTADQAGTFTWTVAR